jgi:hypothetical protein
MGLPRHFDAAVAYVISTPTWRRRNLTNSAWMRFLALARNDNPFRMDEIPRFGSE